MIDPRRALLLELLSVALAAVDGRGCTARALRARGITGEYWVVGIGKAASHMALGALDALGSALKRTLIITKDGHVESDTHALPALTLCESSHPVPDQRSLAAGARLLSFIAELPAHVQPVFLVSGGASSLVEVLPEGVGLEDLIRLNAEGLASGIAIEELNARRGRLSLIKGGRLAARLAGRPALALFISDVPTDDPALIGSGILGPPPAELAVEDRFERQIVASIDTALQAVRAQARELAASRPTARFAGEADALANAFASELLAHPRGLLLWGGESVVQLPARPGHGGRNQHLALCAAQRLAGHADRLLLAVGTDGTDGPTSDAGALVDGDTLSRIALAGLDAADCLRRADSATALAAAGDLVHTGPTGTNVGDLALGLSLSKSEALTWLNRQSHAPAPDR